MNYSNEAEQVVKIVLDGSEWVLRLSGAGLEHLIPMIAAALKGDKQTKGKARLETLIRSGKPLKAFAVKDEQLALFAREAKKYGVMYTALKDEEGKSGWTDVLAKVDDAEYPEGCSKEGTVFDGETLYWTGYLYRRWHFYTGESSKAIYKMANAKTMNTSYLEYHTLDIEEAIDHLRERTHI